MVKNNTELDVKVKCIKNRTTQAQIAEDIGITRFYVNRAIKKHDGVLRRYLMENNSELIIYTT